MDNKATAHLSIADTRATARRNMEANTIPLPEAATLADMEGLEDTLARAVMAATVARSTAASLLIMAAAIQVKDTAAIRIMLTY